MRILIVGAGIAGLSLASLLKQRGLNPTVIEKAASFDSVGYMIGLYPTGANVLRALNCYDQYLDASVAGKMYEAYTEKANLLKRFSFAPIVQRYGAYQLITRYDLLNILYQTCDDLDIRFNTQVAALMQHDHDVEVTFNNQTSATFDLIVGADGLHSQVRDYILTKEEYRYTTTGWGGWVWWSQQSKMPECTIQEFWGNGIFMGIYPVKGKIGIIAAVNSSTAEEALQGRSRKAFIEEKFASIFSKRPDLLGDFPTDEQNVFFWSLKDQRASNWYKGHVVLLGDAAAAFLPTAGVGASMALESAAVLNDILSRTGTNFIPHALSLFEKRRKARVEKVQNNSRGLAKMMFVSSSVSALIRNYFTKMMSAELLIKSIVKGFDDPI